MKAPTAASLAAIAAAIALFAPSCSRDKSDKPDIGVVLRSSDDPLSSAARKAMSAATTGKADISFAYSGLRAADQASSIESFLDKGRRALVIDPVDSISARSAIAGAKAKGVPLVFMGSMPAENLMLSWDKVFYVGSKNRDAGTIMAEILAEHRERTPASDRNGDGELQYIFIAGDPGLQDTAELSIGLSEALEISGLKPSLVMEAETSGGAADARRKVELAIERFGNRIEAIACADWAIAQGAIEACEKAGRQKGAAAIPIVSVHRSASSPELKAALDSGKIVGAAALDAEAIGKAALSLALMLAEGKDPAKSGHRMSDAKYLWIPYTKVSKTRNGAAP